MVVRYIANVSTRVRFPYAAPIMNITSLVKGRTAKFQSYRNNVLFYTIQTEDELFKFGVPIEEVAGATLPAEEKAIFFMRWIKKWVSNKDSVVTEDKDGNLTVVKLDS